MQNKIIDCFGHKREVGELWLDRAGNECHSRANGTISVRTVNDDDSMAIQSERDKCDLNIIKSIYDKTGIMNNVRSDQPSYGGFVGSRDYHELLLRAQDAEEDFMLLDAHIRARFDNDPGKLLDFVNDPKNRSMAIELGLMAAPPVYSEASNAFQVKKAHSPQASQVPQGEKAPPSKDGV